MNLTARLEIGGALLEGRGSAVVQKHLERFVVEAGAFLLREVKTRTPQGVGGASGLMGSIQQTVAGRGTPAVRATVGTPLEYGAIVERGRRPGKMPPGGKDEPLSRRPLLPWIKLKFGVDGPEADRLEYLVRRKIGRVGIEGKAMFFKALYENQERLRQMAQRQGLTLTLELERE